VEAFGVLVLLMEEVRSSCYYSRGLDLVMDSSEPSSFLMWQLYRRPCCCEACIFEERTSKYTLVVADVADVTENPIHLFENIFFKLEKKERLIEN
jgi:hypothetical protein